MHFKTGGDDFCFLSDFIILDLLRCQEHQYTITHQKHDHRGIQTFGPSVKGGAFGPDNFLMFFWFVHLFIHKKHFQCEEQEKKLILIFGWYLCVIIFPFVTNPFVWIAKRFLSRFTEKSSCYPWNALLWNICKVRLLHCPRKVFIYHTRGWR